jgi:hypothetical protein
MARSFGVGPALSERSETGFTSSFVSFVQHGSTKPVSLGESLESGCCVSPIECENCHSPSAHLFVAFAELPEILILQVARFGKRWFGLGKVFKMVSFPLSGMDMSHFVARDIEVGPSHYDLTAVVFHEGFMDSGHYQCYARKGARWSLFNDADVTEVSPEDVLSCPAYLLFYTRVPPPEVSRVRHEILARDIEPVLALPLRIYSDPRLWRESIPRGVADVDFGIAEELVNGTVLREATEDDRRAILASRLPLAKQRVRIDEGAMVAVWQFVSEKGPMPAVTDLDVVEGGVTVAETVGVFYVDPASLPPEQLSAGGDTEEDVNDV